MSDPTYRRALLSNVKLGNSWTLSAQINMQQEQLRPRVWIEKSLVRNSPDRQNPAFSIGRALLSPAKTQAGQDRYKAMRELRPGDPILHLTDNEAFTAVSLVASPFRSLRRGREEWYLVDLCRSVRLNPPLPREMLFSGAIGTSLQRLVDEGMRYTFYTRNLKLQQGQYLTEASPQLLATLDNAYERLAGRSFSSVIAEL
jgi:hypothetical protein